MLSISSTQKHESKKCPGVSFTVRTLNAMQRAERDLPIAAHRLRYVDMYQQLAKTTAKLEANIDLTKDEATERARLIYEMELISWAYLKPASIRAGLVSVDGVQIDGAPATAESLLAKASDHTGDIDALLDEIWHFCETGSGLPEEQAKNSGSPITSTVQEGGGETSSTAQPAAA